MTLKRISVVVANRRSFWQTRRPQSTNVAKSRISGTKSFPFPSFHCRCRTSHPWQDTFHPVALWYGSPVQNTVSGIVGESPGSRSVTYASATLPPSMRREAPLIWPARSDARNTVAVATSAGSAYFPSGYCEAKVASACSRV